jgi:hypothetical protein
LPGYIKFEDDQDASLFRIMPSILQIKNMTGKKITIAGTENRFDDNLPLLLGGQAAGIFEKMGPHLSNYDQKINTYGIIGYGADAIFKGITIDQGLTLTKKIESINCSGPWHRIKIYVCSKHTIKFTFDGSDEERSVTFCPNLIKWFDDGLSQESKALDYIALPNYYKHESGLPALCISIYNSKDKVQECDKPNVVDEASTRQNNFWYLDFVKFETKLKIFTIKNNTSSDITINNVQSSIKRYCDAGSSPWKLIGKTIKRGEAETVQIKYNLHINQDSKVNEGIKDKGLAFYYTKEGSAPKTFGNFFLGDLYDVQDKKTLTASNESNFKADITSTAESVNIEFRDERELMGGDDAIA